MIAIVVINIVVVMTLWSGLSYVLEKRAVVTRMQDAAHQALARMSNSLAGPMWDLDAPQIDKIVNSELLHQDVCGIAVKDGRGKLVLSKIKDAVGRITAIRSDSAAPSGNVFMRISEHVTRDSQLLGTVEISLTDRYMISGLREIVLRILVQTVLVVSIIVCTIALFFRKYIIKRVEAINTGIGEIENSNYHLKISDDGDDELQHIASSINTMSQTILMREQQLVKLQHYLLNIIESMPSMLISLNSEGVVTHWNMAAACITGIDATEAIGKTIWDLQPELTRYRALFQDALENNRSRTLVRELLSDKTARYFNISVFPLPADGYESGKGVVFRLDDITEIENKENQLRHMQKMEMVGTLAGGLAHDFNNVLCGILGTVSVLEMQIRRGKELSSERLCEKLEVVVELGNRAADIVAQLMVISRKQEASLAPVDLKLTIKHVMKICQNTFDKSIEITAAVPETPIMVNADPVQIEQVLLNLCVNASHAMTIMRNEGTTHGGELSIATEKLITDRHFCASHPEAVEDAEYWVLSVRDTGIGMDTKTVAKIFDPFFTTKEKGKGTGLGLAMVYNIVQQHKGFIDVYSEVGIGSSFNVYLPVYSGNGGDIVVKGHESLPLGEGLVLVVDDEPYICQAAKAILEECGYQVILAENGEVAVSVYNERNKEIKAVVMDMVMPKKSGMDAFIEMKRIDPDVKVLLASGFMQDERMAALTEMGVSEFIKKPYTMLKLATAVARLMA